MENLVYIPTFGTGLGHASRIALVAERLKADGYNLHFSSFNEGREYLLTRGYGCDEVPALDIAWTDVGSPSVRLTLKRFPNMISRFALQVGMEARRMIKMRPKIVLSDSRLSPIIAARLLGLPSICILNQIRILLPADNRSQLIRLFEQTGAEILGVLWARSDAILVPDLPPPNTICSRNLERIGSAEGKVEYIGFLVPTPRINEERIAKVRSILEIDGSKPIVFAQISGPPGTKEELIAILLQIGKESKGRFNLIISAGIPRGKSEPLRLGDTWFFEWCPFREEIFSMMDLALVRGGHSTIGSAISFGKPMLVMPIARHTEQMGNAERVEEIGLGLGVRAEDASKGEIVDALEELLSSEKYRSRASEMKAIASRYNSVERCMERVSIAVER